MIMIVAVLITIFLVAVVYYQIWKVEVLERSILALYAHLKQADIQELHMTSQSYLLQITAGSFLKQISPESDAVDVAK